MQRSHWAKLSLYLLLAMSILISTWVAALASDFGLWVLTGPALLALSILVIGPLGSPPGTLRQALPQALIVATIVLVVSAILAYRDPAKVVEMLPILGSSAFFGTSLSGRRSCCPPQREASSP